MAIAFDNSTQRARYTAGSNPTFSHTCTGSDLILFVFVNVINPASNRATAVTYNGVSLTKVRDVFPQSNVNTSLWYLVNPATGSNTVSITLNAALGTYVDCAAVSYTGVAQSSPIDVSDSSTSNASSITDSVTTTTDNCWVVASGYHGDTSSGGFSTGMTNREITITGSRRGIIGDSNSVVSPAGSKSATINGNSTQTCGIVIAAFKPAGAAPAATPFSQAIIIM